MDEEPEGPGPGDRLPRYCTRCARGCDDLLRVRINYKVARVCPGCAADRRLKGDRVEVLGSAE